MGSCPPPRDLRGEARLPTQRGGFVTVTGKGKIKAPISSHPVFPAIVALWFAALLGLGSLVLPVVLLEKAITATGLASVLPAAQPPLGVTALILIALSAASVGAIAGLSIARKVAAAQAAPAPRRRRAEPSQADCDPEAKRPISAREELGMDGLDAPAERSAPPIAGRRRALSVTDENRRSDFLESAPLPGCDPQDPPALEDDPLDLGDFAQPEEQQPEDEPSEPEQPATAAFGSASLSAAPHTPGVLPMALGQFAERASARPAAAPEEARRFDPSPASAAPAFEDIRMSYSASAAAPFAGFEVEGNSSDGRFAADPVEAAGADGDSAAAPRAELAAMPLGELGTVELVERFALALQRRAQAEDCPLELPAFKATAPAAPFAPEPVAPEGPAVAPAPEPAIAAEPPVPQAFVSPPVPEIPAALRPIGFDEDDGDVDGDEPIEGLSLSLEPQVRPFAQPAAAAQEAGEERAHDDGGEEEQERDGYSSLLAMRSPLGGNREFVRVEDEDDGDHDGAIEPVVVFPGQQQPRRAAPASDGPTRDPLTQAGAPKTGFRPFDGPVAVESVAPGQFAEPATPPAKKADSGETERALREALEKLQRMSGAA